MAFSQNCGANSVPIMMMPVVIEHRSVMTMSRSLKYARFMIGSAARCSAAMKTGISTRNAMRNG